MAKVISKCLELIRLLISSKFVNSQNVWFYDTPWFETSSRKYDRFSRVTNRSITEFEDRPPLPGGSSRITLKTVFIVRLVVPFWTRSDVLLR